MEEGRKYRVKSGAKYRNMRGEAVDVNSDIASGGIVTLHSKNLDNDFNNKDNYCVKISDRSGRGNAITYLILPEYLEEIEIMQKYRISNAFSGDYRLDAGDTVHIIRRLPDGVNVEVVHSESYIDYMANGGFSERISEGYLIPVNDDGSNIAGAEPTDTPTVKTSLDEELIAAYLAAGKPAVALLEGDYNSGILATILANYIDGKYGND